MISSFAKTAVALASLAIAAAAAAQYPSSSGTPLAVQINGQAVSFADTQPLMMGSVVMVPIRGVCEQMGGSIGWDQSSHTVTCNVNGSNVSLQLGNSEGTVDGRMIYLDLPPTVVGDRTMVPISFFKNAYGDTVTWNSNTDLVAIDTSTATTGVSASTNNLTTTPATISLQQDEIVPVTLDVTLSSSTNQVGDTFTATVVSNNGTGYEDLPSGTKIEGHVAAVQPSSSDQPGILDLAFDRVDFPNGQTEIIDVSLISLDSQYATQREDGTYAMNTNDQTYERMAYIGYGPENGTLVGVHVDEPLEGQALDDSMSDLSAQVPEYDRQPSDVILPSGSQMGVRIDQPITVNLNQ